MWDRERERERESERASEREGIRRCRDSASRSAGNILFIHKANVQMHTDAYAPRRVIPRPAAIIRERSRAR